MEDYLDVFLILGVVGANGGCILRWIGFGSIGLGGHWKIESKQQTMVEDLSENPF